MEPLSWLANEGFRVAPYIITDSEEEALRWARRKYPVVVKAVAEGLYHKSDRGGVILDNYTPHALREAIRKVKRAFPHAKVMVQRQIRGGLEVYVGIKRDPTFGPILLLGLGGIYVELLRQLSYRPCPVSKEDVEEMLEETPLHKAVEGFRGKVFDKEGLKAMLVKLCRAVDRWGVDEMDINPLLLLEKGYYIVDVKVKGYGRPPRKGKKKGGRG